MVFSVAIERSQIHARVADSEGAGGGWAGVDRGGSASSFPLSTKLESEFSSKDRHGEHKKERQVEEEMIKRRWKEEGRRKRGGTVGEERREGEAEKRNAG